MALTALSAVAWGSYSVGIGALAGAWFEDHHLLGVMVAIGIAVLIGIVVDRIITLVRGNTPVHPRPQPLRSSLLGLDSVNHVPVDATSDVPVEIPKPGPAA